MLCRAPMSPCTVSTNQVLWSEPTRLTLGESRIEAGLLFRDNWQSPWTLPSKKQRVFLQLGFVTAGVWSRCPLCIPARWSPPLPSDICSLGCSPPPALPWWWARRWLHMLHWIMIFFIQFWAGEIQFVTGPVCSLGLYKPPGMYTRKMYIINTLNNPDLPKHHLSTTNT